MNKENGRALNRMKLTLRKHNKQYEDQINAYKEVRCLRACMHACERAGCASA